MRDRKCGPKVHPHPPDLAAVVAVAAAMNMPGIRVNFPICNTTIIANNKLIYSTTMTTTRRLLAGGRALAVFNDNNYNARAPKSDSSTNANSLVICVSARAQFSIACL